MTTPSEPASVLNCALRNPGINASDNLNSSAAISTALCASEQGLWQQAVLLWMEWHTAQERLTAAMFRSRHDTAQQAELLQQMDQLDQLRWRAVELSQDMLDHASE